MAAEGRHLPRRKGLKEEEEKDRERKGSGKREGNDQRRARGPQGNKGAVGRGRGLPGGEAASHCFRDPMQNGLWGLDSGGNPKRLWKGLFSETLAILQTCH